MGDIRSSVDACLQPEYPLTRVPSGHPAKSPANPLSRPPACNDASAERLLAGRYLIEATIGEGSMGTVFRARDLRTETLCAIKMLTRMAVKDAASLTRFANEAAVIAQLFHPNIVEIREFRGDDKGCPFIVMELLNGTDLHSHLAGRRRLPLERVQSVVRQVASAIHAAHSLGIVHRDIKPRNIFLAQQESTIGGAATEIVKVVDFGLAKTLGETQHQTAVGDILGTPEYLAPEGTTGHSKLIDERTDQWALAVTAYRMLAGRLPFEDDDVFRLLRKIREEPLPLICTVAPDLPDYVVRTLAIALSKKKADRFPSVLAFTRALCEPSTGPTGQRPGNRSLIAPRLLSPEVLSTRQPPRNRAAQSPAAEPRPAVDPLRQTQPIDPAILSHLLVQSQSAELPQPRTPPGRDLKVESRQPDAGGSGPPRAGASLEGRPPPGHRNWAAWASWLPVLMALGVGSLWTQLYRPYRSSVDSPPSVHGGPAASGSAAVPQSVTAAWPVSPARPWRPESSAGAAGSPSAAGRLPADPIGQPPAAPPGQGAPPGFKGLAEPGGGRAGKRATPAPVRRVAPAREPTATTTLARSPPVEPALSVPSAGAEPVPMTKSAPSVVGPPELADNGAQAARQPVALTASRSSQNPGQKPAAAFERARTLKPLTAPDPQFPGWARSVLGREPVSGLYQLCIQTSGSVERVVALVSIPPADEAIIATLKTWKFPPQTSPICITKEFQFEVSH